MPGTIGRWREPAGPGVRIDSGVEEGMVVSGDYDPLLSKILVVGTDRDDAIRRARRAVDEMETGGIQTTLPFHAWLLRHPAFVAGDVRTDLVDRDWDPAPPRAAAARLAIDAVASYLGTNGMSISGPIGVGPDGSAPSAPVTAGTQRDGTQRDGTQRDGTQRDGTGRWTQTARREATERWP